MINTKLTIATLVILLFASCKKSDSDTTPPPNPPPNPPVVTTLADNDPLLFGNPTNADTLVNNFTNFLKNSVYYKISYNNTRGISNWVAWHFQSEDDGNTPRQDDFRHDYGLPSAFNIIESNAYSGSGFDRGHNCPSADRTTTVAANSSTFLMSNIIPQAPNFNQGPWDALETYMRNTLVASNNEAYVLMGNFGTGGTGSNGYMTAIYGSKVTVPATVYKVILVMSKGNSDIARLNRDTKVLAVSMPNDNTLYSTSSSGRDAWKNYLVSVNTIEKQAAGVNPALNIFKGVPDSIRSILKEKMFTP